MLTVTFPETVPWKPRPVSAGVSGAPRPGDALLPEALGCGTFLQPKPPLYPIKKTQHTTTFFLFTQLIVTLCSYSHSFVLFFFSRNNPSLTVRGLKTVQLFYERVRPLLVSGKTVDVKKYLLALRMSHQTESTECVN